MGTTQMPIDTFHDQLSSAFLPYHKSIVLNVLMGNPLVGYWDGSGLELGDTVLIHSSMKRTFGYLLSCGVQPDPKMIIDSLLNLIGKKGTILFPLFNFDFPKSKEFSMISTPSQMGAVTEFARKNYQGYRTGHPIYSFYAIGSSAGEFKGINNRSGYGKDSPFAKLLDLDGKIASIDLDDQNSMTMYHFVEESMSVDYRYFKTFSGRYQSQLGLISDEEYILFVRDIEKGVKTDVNRMGEILWSEGHYIGNRPGCGNGMRSIKATSFVGRTTKEISEGRAVQTLYSVG
jgi:aminoglycoside 3-N-acetyltransferase